MPDRQSPSPNAYSGPAAAILEKDILTSLPLLLISFSSTSGAADAILEQTAAYAKNAAQNKTLGLLNNYARATLAEGTFTEKWQPMLDNVSRTDPALARVAASAVLDSNFAGAAAIINNEQALTAARKTYLLQGMREAMSNLSLSNEGYQKLLRAQPDYKEEVVEQNLVNFIDQYFYLTQRAGTFKTDWPAKLEEISRFDAELAVQTAAKFFERPKTRYAMGTDGKPVAISFALPIDDFEVACAAAQRACILAGQKGHAPTAAATMSSVMDKIEAEFKTPGRPEAEQTALRRIAISALATRKHILLDGMKAAMAGPGNVAAETAPGVIADQKSNLLKLMGAYSLHTLQTGTFARDWSAKMDEVNAFDPELAAEAAGNFLRTMPAALSVDDFIAASAKAQQVSVRAAEQGHNDVAAETMALVNRQLRIQLRHEELPEDKAAALRALQDLTETVEGGFLESGIKETMATLSLSDAELRQRRAQKPGYSEESAEARLFAVLDEYFYHTLKKGTLLTDWPAKLEEVSSFDPDLAAEAAAMFFREPQASLHTTDEYNRIFNAAAQACTEASAKGFFASAARTMADMLVEIRGTINALADREDMVSALRATGNEAVGKFNSIMQAWATVAFEHEGDTRTPEQIRTAQTALQKFVQSLGAQGFNMGGEPPPAPPAS